MRYPLFRLMPFFLFFFLLAVEAPFNFAQTQRSTSGLRGAVTDTSGAVVPGAKVTLRSESEGYTRNALTNGVGVFVFLDLTPGMYDVTVRASGFKEASAKGITLYVGQTVVQNFHLEVGEVTQTVSVKGTAPLLNQTSGTVGTIVGSTTITELPLNGRNFLQLPLLSPGASYDKNGNTQDSVNIDPTSHSFNMEGARGDYNYFTLDGSLIMDWVNGAPSFSPDIDAVQEFQAAGSNYSAASGVEAAGQINLVTKSGTNRFHGDAYEFLRNTGLNARNFFSPTNPPFHLNQFGGTLGGPFTLPKIYNGKNKSFFFVSYEGLRWIEGTPLLANYPTPAQLTGDLSSSTTPVINPSTGQAFPGNIIPQSDMPAHLESFLQNGIGKGPWLPVPNSTTPGLDYYTLSNQLFGENQTMARFDQKIGSKTFMYGRYAINSDNLTNPNSNPNWRYIQDNRAQNVAFGLAMPIKSNFLAEFTFGFNRFHQNEYYTTAYTNNIIQQLGIQGLGTIPASWGAPGWDVAGYTGLGEDGSAPRGWKEDDLQFSPAFSWIKGKHSMRFGSDIYRDYVTFPEALIPAGSFSFDGEFTGNALGDLLLGLPASVEISTTPFNPLLQYTLFDPYFQDNWNVAPYLTLDLGLRYELDGWPISANKSTSNLYLPPNAGLPEVYVQPGYAPITFDGVKQTLLPNFPVVTAPSIGLPDSLVTKSDTDFAPRFGFAYTLPRTSNTVLRGGFGLFYQRDTDNGAVDLALNPPFISSIGYSLNQSNISQFNWFNPSVLGTASPFGYYTMVDNYRVPRTYQYNLALEHTQWGALFSLAYVGSVSDHLANMEYPNQAHPGPGSFASRSPWPTGPEFYYQNWDGIGNYNSLQVKFQKPFAHGFTLISGYTWSKAMDDTGGNFVGEGSRSASTQNAFDLLSSYSLSNQDVPQRFSVGYLYQLPFGSGKRFLNRGGAANAVLGGWQLSGITTLQSGNPVFIDQACNRANTDEGTMRPTLVGSPNLPGDRSTGAKVAEWFNTSAFQNYCPGPNGPFNFGNAGRNIVLGPGINDWDFSLHKEILIGETRHFEFRAEFFNIFNTPIFAQPGGEDGGVGFGAISSTAESNREIQFALKFYF